MCALQPVVSIIIPVYNAEDTLHTCLSSLERQTYAYLELIFVNDCSQDRSPQVLEDFMKKVANRGLFFVKIVNHKENKGVAAARNTGLDYATGEYIYYVDADDWIEENAIQSMVAEAESTTAEIVGFDWYLSFEKNERRMRQPSFSSPEDAIIKMIHGKMRWNLWIFLVKRSLYEKHGIRFQPKMNMGEDMMVMFKLFSVADKVVYLNRALYHYGQTNSSSLTKIYSDRHMEEVTHNLKEVERFLLRSRYADKICGQIALLKLNIKLPLLISDKTEQYRKWRCWFVDSNSFAWSNGIQSIRLRVIQWAACRRQFWIIKLHYYFITRIMYGVFYK